ncbi:MAG: hypothetical protein Q4B86_07130 [Eubacteriales bacterium]|nr:hypothetical protein [Eubacteriales bacterium]
MNIIRIATVSSYDKNSAMMRVVYHDTNVMSAELPVFCPFGCIPSYEVGQQVAVLSESNIESIVIGAFEGKVTIDDSDINWIKKIPDIDARLKKVEGKV